jgi:hypothetical protein
MHEITSVKSYQWDNAQLIANHPLATLSELRFVLLVRMRGYRKQTLQRSFNCSGGM